MSGGPGTNGGHGHVWTRPDGVKARCGGPAVCHECALDQARYGAAAKLGADHGPITPELHGLMNGLAHALDEIFNGKDAVAAGERKVGFFLAAFNMGDVGDSAPPTGRFNYISNAEKLDVRAMLKEIAARIEGRLAAEERPQ